MPWSLTKEAEGQREQLHARGMQRVVPRCRGGGGGGGALGLTPCKEKLLDDAPHTRTL